MSSISRKLVCPHCDVGEVYYNLNTGEQAVKCYHCAGWMLIDIRVVTTVDVVRLDIMSSQD